MLVNRLFVLFIFILVVAHGAFAQELEAPNPGNTGTNAFEFVKYADDISMGDKIELKFEFTSSENFMGEEDTMIFYVRVPVKSWVMIGADMRQETYTISEEAAEEFDIENREGRDLGDLNFWTMIKLMEERGNLPALALKVTVKTASGEFKEARRFTDTAGYEFVIAAEKSFFENEDALIRKVTLLMEAGLVVWDTNQAEQNDAYKLSGVLSADIGRFNARVGALHFRGWQDKEVDNYLGIKAQISYRLNNKWMIDAQYRRGLTKSAPKNYFGLGVRYFLDKLPINLKKEED